MTLSILYRDIAIVAIIRIGVVCFGIGNYDYPDQYWQGPEIAHKIAYGYGYQTWQWTMEQPIRSPLYPLYLACGYWFLNFAGLAIDSLIHIIPWIMNAIIVIIGDIYLLKLIKFYYGEYNFIQFLTIFTNWYYLSIMSRTYINTIQTSLTLIAFYYWVNSRIFVAICYLSRPTSLVFWAVVWPYQLFTLSEGHFRFIIKNIIQIVLMICMSGIIGFLWYGKIQFTELNFIKYNIFLGWSQFYGSSSYITYFAIFFPAILGSNIIPLGLSFFQIYKFDKIKETHKLIKISKLRELSFLIFIILLVLSFSVHKEMRFLLTFLPFGLIISILGTRNTKKNILPIIIGINLLLFWGFSCYGKNGGVEAIKYLSHQLKNNNQTLMVFSESHSIPLYCILHRNIQVAIPDSSAIKKSKNEDEQKLLISDPKVLFERLLGRLNRIPKFVISQQNYLKYTNKILQDKGYKILKEFRNSNIFQQLYLGKIDKIIIYKN